MHYRVIFLLLIAALPAQAQPSVAPAKPYEAAVAELEKFIAAEVEDKKLPALSIALVDDQKIVWASGFGFKDRAKKIPATAETVYRVGSVSKLFTDVAVMQLVEEGKLDLDAPVAKYVPDFKPKYGEGQKEITLRKLMAHRSGLIREPPVGNYFDPTEPTLKKTVASLNGIDIVYPPGERTKYSNAGIGLVGFTLEKSQNEKFEKYVQRRVLDELGMKSASFLPTDAVKKNLAEALMWTYHGREFPAPTFELGMSPAGCMYASVLDIAKFHSCLFADGKLGDKRLLKPESIAEMFKPQFVKDGTRGFGLGFILGDLDGHKRIGHGGAVYGFATEFAALPGEKLGAIVVSSRDTANATSTRIANQALRMMLAAKAGKPLPKIEKSEPLPVSEAKALAGRYIGKDSYFDLIESAGRLFLQPGAGGYLQRIQASGNNLIVDDSQAWGPVIVRGEHSTLTIGKNTYIKESFLRESPEKPDKNSPDNQIKLLEAQKKALLEKGLKEDHPDVKSINVQIEFYIEMKQRLNGRNDPAEPPAKWLGLIGEYGWDHNTLFIYERDGKLHALIEWTEIDPLTEESENVFAFPKDRGMYHGEKLVFTRDKAGRATSVESAKVVFQRRKIDGENGETFQIKPVKPLDELRKAALAAKPPEEKGEFLKPDLVDLETIKKLKFDIRYATDNNFLAAPFYTSAKAYMQKPAAAALAKVQTNLEQKGYGLLIYDAYRPWYVTKMFWDATPEKFHGFVADPSKGSRHNRGCAVDLGLYDLKTGKVVPMVSGYDEFSDRAFPDYMGGTSRQRWHRDLLRRSMEAEGFTVYEEEWWHFDYKDWKKYPIGNLTFEQLGK